MVESSAAWGEREEQAQEDEGHAVVGAVPRPGQGEEVWISLWEPCRAADGSSPHDR